MIRYPFASVLTVLAALCPTTPSASDPQKPESRPLEAVLTTRGPVIELEAAPLKDQLAFFADRFGMTIIVDREAFKAIGFQEVESQPVRLDKVSNLKAGEVLQLLLSPIGANFKEQDGVLIVVPQEHMVAARQLRRPVDATFEKKPLQEALDSLSRPLGISVVLDARVSKQAQTAVSGSFRNVPIDTAVRLLADMADLKMVTIDNALYVTSKENARELRREQQRHYLDAPPAMPLFGTPGPRISVPTVSVDAKVKQGH
jgi:hypothetical protein